METFNCLVGPYQSVPDREKERQTELLHQYRAL